MHELPSCTLETLTTTTLREEHATLDLERPFLKHKAAIQYLSLGPSSMPKFLQLDS